MAHFFAPKPPDQRLPVFYNLDGVVGASPAQNYAEDVLLVQFAFWVIGRNPKAGNTPELNAAAKAVQLTGKPDAATLTAIRVHQQSVKTNYPATVVDGRASPVRGGYSYGGGYWTIVVLNNALQDRYLDIWPRIDKIPGCPAPLKEMVMRQVVGRGSSA